MYGHEHVMRRCKGCTRKKANSNKTCVSMHTWINHMVIMKIKIETIPSRITTYFQREVCSRRKTNTDDYHKRKWNKKVTSKSKTGTKQIFTNFHLWARSTGLFSAFWFNSHYYDGLVFRCFVRSLYFLKIITQGNNHLTSATKHCKINMCDKYDT